MDALRYGMVNAPTRAQSGMIGQIAEETPAGFKLRFDQDEPTVAFGKDQVNILVLNEEGILAVVGQNNGQSPTRLHRIGLICEMDGNTLTYRVSPDPNFQAA